MAAARRHLAVAVAADAGGDAQIPGDELADCVVLDGVMINKDVTHSRMRRRIENPRILLLDCPLEYKKSESQVWTVARFPPWRACVAVRSRARISARAATLVLARFTRRRRALCRRRWK